MAEVCISIAFWYCTLNTSLSRKGSADRSNMGKNIHACCSARDEEPQHAVPSAGKMCLISDTVNEALQPYIGFPLMSVCCKKKKKEKRKRKNAHLRKAEARLSPPVETHHWKRCGWKCKT